MSRPCWSEYFLDIAALVATRSTCPRRSVGAVIAVSNIIVSTGYCGVPTGIKHPSEVGCPRDLLGVPSGEQLDLCNDLHAEENSIILAAKHGISVNTGVMYCTESPCKHCCLLLINAGIREVVYRNGYADIRGLALLEEAHIIVTQFKGLSS